LPRVRRPTSMISLTWSGARADGVLPNLHNIQSLARGL
jgi:hypothetical protein